MSIKEQVTKIVDTDSTLVGASVTQRGAKGAQSIEIVDASGNQITEFGNGTSTPTSTGGGKVTVSKTAIEVTFIGTTKAIKIEAHYDNTGYIYYGLSDVGIAGENAYGMLVAGDSISVDFNDSTESLYVIADTDDQVIFKMKLS